MNSRVQLSEADVLRARLSEADVLRARIVELEGELAEWRRLGEAGAFGLELDARQERLASMRVAFGLEPAQARLLAAFLSAPGRTLRDEALLRIIALHDDVEIQLLKVQVSRLRKAIGYDTIERVKTLGYRLNPSAAPRLEAATSLALEAGSSAPNVSRLRNA